MKNLPAIFLASTLLATAGTQSKAKAGDNDKVEVKSEIKDPIEVVSKGLKEDVAKAVAEADKARVEADEARAAVAKARLLVQEREKKEAEAARINKSLMTMFGKKGPALLEAAEKVAIEFAKTPGTNDDEALRADMEASLKRAHRYKITPEGVANALRHLPVVKKEADKTAEKPTTKPSEVTDASKGPEKKPDQVSRSDKKPDGARPEKSPSTLALASGGRR